VSKTAVLQAAGLLQTLAMKGIAVKRLANDSRTVAAGDVFLAYPGHFADGRVYLADALTRGAAAILYEARAPQDGKLAASIETAVNQANAAHVPCLAVDGLAAVAGELAHQVFGRPSEKLWLAGVTGTNGKTSVSQWLLQALTCLGQRCAVVGTLGNGFLGDLRETGYTTPDVLQLHAALDGFVAQGARACVMEVSSIGLAEGRVHGVRFDVAVFTNLTRDHLDYHGTMAAYGEAKAALFANSWINAAVVNLDDPFAAVLINAIRPGVRIIGYTLDAVCGARDELPSAIKAEIKDRHTAASVEILAAENLAMTTTGLAFDVQGQVFSVPVVGRFNVANVLAVIAALAAKGERLADIAAALRQLQAPPGRMQAVGGEAEPLVIVDYAHTPDALENVLQVAREIATVRGGKLACVFGCGGDRDAGKRPVMGSIAERLADHVVVTSDNPRSENPAQIIQAIVAGMLRQACVLEQRDLAIAQAVAQANAEDVIVVAGKGHEAYQEIAGVREAFNDVDAAKSALAARRQQYSTGGGRGAITGEIAVATPVETSVEISAGKGAKPVAVLPAPSGGRAK
jgi:UDP-N-acetylmuramoyl-L-alanyl-D-glutamate--2,6-diaminopimelate ligase